MSATDRQNKLLVAEDWKRIYQSFRNADFQSYDFENLRRVMISYIRENYPEDFNDYIESSEYLALIDIIAFLGQSISYRTDLNARENFLELAERRESVLRLARLLSYSPKRNKCAFGLLKFTSIQTTQTVYDSNGRNLAGQVITYNDASNQNWYDQFIKVLNCALPSTRQFGKPDDKGVIYGIPTEQYRFQSSNISLPVFSFSKSIDGRNMSFEIVSSTFKDSNEIYEETPLIGNRLSFLYRDDGKGTGSNNTGFFVHFKQGVLSQGTFNIDQPSTNETVDLTSTNINDSDVWLYRLDQNGNESELWTQVPALEGNNVIYNSLNKQIKNIYGVITKASDRISLIFSDGTFGNLPRGQFKVYYRTSNGIAYTINPKDIRNVSISIPYVSNVGQAETLNINLNLVSTISNSSEAESTETIKSKAPSTYYTQNRMITGEDYNISPLSVSQDVIKIKSVNRSSSGISRYYDLVDPTGKYSKTNIFSDDGALYKEEYQDSFRFSYLNKTEIESVIYNKVIGTLKQIGLRDYFYSKYARNSTEQITWKRETTDTNMDTGFFDDTITTPDGAKVGSHATIGSILRHIKIGALLKFEYNQSITWTSVVGVRGTGETKVGNMGPIQLNDNINDGSELVAIIPSFRTILDVSTISTMIELIYENKPFGLRYDIDEAKWKIIFELNLNINRDFSVVDTGDVSNQTKDASWLVLFSTDTEYYTVTYRLLRYVFESDKYVRFFYDSSDKIYDTRTNTVIKDTINILGINEQKPEFKPNDRRWEITNEFIGIDGYVDSKKIQLSFADSDDDGIVDHPELFDEFVHVNGYVITESYETEDGLYDYRLSNAPFIYVLDPSDHVTDYKNGSYFYFSDDIWELVDGVLEISLDYTISEFILFIDQELDSYSIEMDGLYFYNMTTGIVKQLNNNVLTSSVNYKVYRGRDTIKFQYIHNADYETRIDPGLTNIMDIYVLTKNYDKLYRQWISGAFDKEPLPPSTDELYNMMSGPLNKIKSISDEIIYHPVKFKILFGEKATRDLRAIFKVVKNNEIVISDNDVKTRILSAINSFFSLENWDFGDKFYFSELAAYVMNRLSPYIVNFIIVPKLSNLSFGSLYEINAESDQIFINGATVDDIEIINTVTANKIKSAGLIEMENSTVTQQINSARIIE